MSLCCDSTGIIECAFRLHERVTAWAEQARRFFYDVLLADHRCPACSGRLGMRGEGRCTCMTCGREFDPTVEFQRCSDCGGTLRLRVRHYVCTRCGSDAASRFLFDGLVFDAAYFRQKMSEHRRRKQELREQVQRMLMECRSPSIPIPAADMHTVPGLVEALNAFVSVERVELSPPIGLGFDLSLYQVHLQAHIGAFPVSLRDIPALRESPRKDLIWRFVAIIFMAHAGLVEVRQEGPSITVIKRETHSEGQGISGNTEADAGVE